MYFLFFRFESSSVLTCYYQWNNIGAVSIGDRDAYDLTQNSTSAFPPEYYVKYLNREDVVSAIGAESSYYECPDGPYNKFVTTGDVREIRILQ